MSKSEDFLKSREQPPIVTPNMWKSVSQYRRDTLEAETANGLFREAGGSPNYGMQKTSVGSVARIKTAQLSSTNTVSGTSGANWRGNSSVDRLTPEVYSPLWLNSNLNLPRDRSTVNAWARSFFALNPIIHNAISLHSTYPISKLNIKCKDPKIQAFYSTMCEEIDLMNICTQVAQEYWTLGEAFVYGELDERAGKWSRLLIQNPDYMVVQRSVVAGEPIISLRPDENLRRICTSNKPSDIQQKQQLSKNIIDSVKRGQNIPLSNFYVSHLANRISPYEIRGTSLIVSCFRSLMLWDQIKECYDEETEVLTDQGFKKFHEVIEYAEMMDGTFSQPYIVSSPKRGVKIACYNAENNQLEYHEPSESIVKNYNGDMYHFAGKKVDVKVTPGHDLFVKKKIKKNYKGIWTDWQKISAETVAGNKSFWKFKGSCDWIGETVDFVEVCGKQVPIENYLKFLGYLISEGCLYSSYENGRYDNSFSITQAMKSRYQKDIKDTFNKFCEYMDINCNNKEYINESGFCEGKPVEMWAGRFNNKDIVQYFINQVKSIDGKYKSYDKCIPRWVLELNPKLIKILLTAMCNGDGHRALSKYNTDSVGTQYCTLSEQLASDVQEAAFKCGLAPNICTHERDGRNEYYVLWSTTRYGHEPNVYPGLVKKGNGGGAGVEKVQYNGKVWCFVVPTGLFITRRNNKITIQGNCKYAQTADMINPMRIFKVGGGVSNYQPTPADIEQYRMVIEEASGDKNFKLVTHDGFTVETVGAGSGIYDTSNDITQIMKELYIGMMVPNVIMDGGGDISYQNGGVALDVLRQRYTQFRNYLTNWLRRKIFAPISKINEFYELVDGKKKLIIPDIEWNHMSLFDTGDYIQQLSTLVQATPPRVSNQTLYNSLGLEYEDEVRKIRKEQIDLIIQAKEVQSLNSMSLNDLRALKDDSEIKEVVEGPLPGQEGVEPLPGESSPGGFGGSSAPPPPPVSSFAPTPPAPPSK